MSINIWQHRVKNEFGTTEHSREQHMKIQLRPRIKQVYATSKIVAHYHSHLLKIPLARRLLLPSKTNKRWLQHIDSEEASYKRRQMKTLINTTKIKKLFPTYKNKEIFPNPNIITDATFKKKTNQPTTNNHKKIQQTLTGQHYQPTSTQTIINKQKHKYQKIQYSTITNFIEGPHKTIQYPINFLEKPVTLSDIRVPYINRKNKKYKISSTYTQPA